MIDAGHAFVIHGDLTLIAADGVLVPADRYGHVNTHWDRFHGVIDRVRLAAQLRSAPVSDAVHLEGQVLRYVDSGFTPFDADPEVLHRHVRTALEHLSGDVRGISAARERALIAMPLFGVGAGGFDATRGEALRAVLSAASAVARDKHMDVVITCFDRSDYAALQSCRDRGTWAIDDVITAELDRVADRAREGSVVLFMGAGVSAAAGLPLFEDLITQLEDTAGIPPRRGDLPGRAAAIERVLGREQLQARVNDLLSAQRHTLTHALLASLRCREAISPNFDSLYELACRRPFEGSLDVVPWQRSTVNRPWLLKVHGDPARPGGLVLTAESFKQFAQQHKPEAGVLRTMLTLSREILFVGYSLSDANINEIIDEARTAHAANRVANGQIGTVLSVSATMTDTDANPVTLGLRSSDQEPLKVAGRRLDVALDYLAWRATRAESSWILDPRYRALLTSDIAKEAAQVLAEQRLPADHQWRSAEQRLRELGRRD